MRRNIIFERARFNRRNQREGESAEQFITQLYTLVETCDYGALTDYMLRDRIVVSIRDQTLSQRLQTDPSLTLEKAKRTVRQKEAVHEQSNILQGDGTAKSPVAIDQVKDGKPAAAGGKAGAKQPPKTTKTSTVPVTKRKPEQVSIQLQNRASDAVGPTNRENVQR